MERAGVKNPEMMMQEIEDEQLQATEKQNEKQFL